MTVSVIVATFGARRWADRAQERAIPSAEAQQPLEVIVRHGVTLQMARNGGAARARGEWLCFLDADDELEPGYLAALAAADGDLRAPAIRYVVNGIAGEAELLADRDIDTINPCVIGTLIRRDMFHRAGGFWRERAWEDWSLFRRAWLLGATISHTPEAVYRAHVSPYGRNSRVANPRSLHREIIRSHDRWWAKGEDR